MSHRHRTSVLYLFFKMRYDRTVTTQHITETGGYKTGISLYFPFFNSISQTLHIDFSQTLGSSHHIGRIDCLVCRNHYHFLRPIFQSHICNLAGTDYIHQNSLTRIFFHQWHVLVSRRMKNNLGMVKLEYHTKAVFHADISYNGHKI